MTAMTDSTQRISSSERIASLDVMRGIAILFILCMNIPWMLGYAPTLRDPRIPTWTIWDQGAFGFIWTFLNGTQRGLLELLFGAGIMIMARKAMVSDGPVAIADLHYRRNLLLIALGLFNAFVLLWPGDILFPYGLAALVLFPARLLSTRAKIVLASLLLMFPTGLGIRDYVETSRLEQRASQAASAQKAGTTLTADMKKAQEEWNKRIQQTRPIAENPGKKEKVEKIHKTRMGALATYAAGQYETWVEFFSVPDIFWSVMCEIAATMLLGMALFQLGIMQGLASTRTYVAMAVIGYGIGLSLRYWALVELSEFTPSAKYFWFHMDWSRIPVVLGHVAAIHLALRSQLGRNLLRPFVAAGRMPLTTYLFTSLLMCWLVAPGIGLGLHGKFGWAMMQVIALGIIAAEVVATNLWMRYHETGPMEWLWKSLAYGRRQPYRRPVDPEPALVPAQ